MASEAEGEALEIDQFLLTWLALCSLGLLGVKSWLSLGLTSSWLNQRFLLCPLTLEDAFPSWLFTCCPLLNTWAPGSICADPFGWGLLGLLMAYWKHQIWPHSMAHKKIYSSLAMTTPSPRRLALPFFYPLDFLSRSQRPAFSPLLLAFSGLSQAPVFWVSQYREHISKLSCPLEILHSG